MQSHGSHGVARQNRLIIGRVVRLVGASLEDWQRRHGEPAAGGAWRGVEGPSGVRSIVQKP